MDLFKIGFLDVTLIDLLDIAIVSVMIYWIYRSLKNTIAVQILLGLMIIIGFQFITEAINLKSINWILRTISDIWLLAFIILFQPELRRLLLLLTRSPIFRIFVKGKISETIDEIIETVFEMSDSHTGALLVFPRSQNVSMTMETGIELQAKVTRELLISIFNTKSPLHDGAVIIDKDLLLAARCVLPLSIVEKYQSKNLGTRHRAALGLSEQVDAIVLIVSEETGRISLAESGELMLNIPKDRLDTVLRAKLSED